MAVVVGSKKTGARLDDIFLSLGVWGRWQILQIGLVLSLQSVGAYQLLSIVFIGYEPPFRCNVSKNSSQNPGAFNSSCHLNTNNSYKDNSCRFGYKYNIPRELSIVSEWDLVCDKEYLSGLSQTVLIGGQAAGAIFFSFLADCYGRKKVFLMVQWLMLAISTATVFTPNITVFIIFRFITGSLQQGLIMLGAVLPLEVTTMAYRPVILLLTGIIFGSFNGSLALLGYLFQNWSWRYLQVALSVVSVILLVPNMIYLDESLRWLVANGRNRQAQQILKKVAKMNKVRLSADDDLTVQCEIEVNPNNDEDVTATEIISDGSSKPIAVYSFKDIVKHRRLRQFTLVMFIIWIVSSFGYFGLSLEASHLAGDRFVNFFLLGIADVPAAIFSFFTMKWIGRRPTLLIFSGLTGVCMLVSVILTAFVKGTVISNVNTGLAILGKLGIAACFGSLYIYTSELYPTTIRGLGCGISSAASRIGGMVAPFFTMLIAAHPFLFPIVLTSGCVLICLLTFLLPETRDKELPQTLHHIEEWFNRNNYEEEKKNTDDTAQVNLLSDYD